MLITCVYGVFYAYVVFNTCFHRELRIQKKSSKWYSKCKWREKKTKQKNEDISHNSTVSNSWLHFFLTFFIYWLLITFPSFNNLRFLFFLLDLVFSFYEIMSTKCVNQYINVSSKKKNDWSIAARLHLFRWTMSLFFLFCFFQFFLFTHIQSHEMKQKVCGQYMSSYQINQWNTVNWKHFNSFEFVLIVYKL